MATVVMTPTAAGAGTTEDGVLQLAGARNAAAEAGISGNRDISLEALPELRPDYVIVFPWHFRDGIIEREQAYLRQGGRLVFPLPEIEIVGF